MTWYQIGSPSNDRLSWTSPEGEFWILTLTREWIQGSKSRPIGWSVSFTHQTRGGTRYESESFEEMVACYERIRADPITESVKAVL